MPETLDLVASQAPRLLGLAYAPGVPPEVLGRMERAGKRLGLPLEALETLGQDRELCEGFCAAAERDGRLVLRAFREGGLDGLLAAVRPR